VEYTAKSSTEAKRPTYSTKLQKGDPMTALLVMTWNVENLFLPRSSGSSSPAEGVDGATSLLDEILERLASYIQRIPGSGH
jgi:hypothetical protein